MDRTALFRSPIIKHWSMIELGPGGRFCNEPDMTAFMKQMIHFSKLYGNFSQVDPLRRANSDHHIGYQGQLSHPQNVNKLRAALRSFKDKSVLLLVVILAKDTISDYALVKKVAEVDVGIHTTCIIRNKNKKPGGPEIKRDPQTIANIFQKINMRAGGINVARQLKPIASGTPGRLFTATTIVIGADVTHPGVASSKVCPSIAAVVGSTEIEFNRYATSLSAQTSKVEKIERFGEMVGERLKLWKKHNKRYPNQIVIFRDGVSESQFQMVLNEEWPSIDREIAKIYQGEDKPKILLMCVLKRHGTRFFPNPSNLAHSDRHGNPHPGLVVEDIITYPDGYDWYLQSHACIQGTAKPAHYVVLRDTLKLPSNVVQQEVREFISQSL